MKHINVIYILLIGFVLSPNLAFAASEDRVGRFYELGSPLEGKPIFVQKIHRQIDSDGKRISDSTIEDSDGKVVMTEHAVLNGYQVVSQRIDQLQIGKSYDLELKDGKVIFRTYKLKDGKRELTSENTVTEESKFITGPATEPFLKEQFDRDLSSETVRAEFGIFEFEKSVGFEFRRKGTLNDGNVTKIRLRPSGFWLSLLVDPIDMEFDTKTFILLRYKGRTPLRKLVHGSWKPLDAQIVYAEK